MNNQTGPRVPVRPAPPPPTSTKQGANSTTSNSNKQDGTSSNKKSSLNITKLLPNIIKKPSNTSSRTVTTNKKAPPPRPPPPKFAPKKPIIDLLSGSPPSSPSPTLRSQESGFEEDPDLWRGWSDSSRSTPLLDWPSEPPTPVIEWTSESVTASAAPAPQWKSESAPPQQWPAPPQQWPAPPIQQPACVRPPTMPTIIRPGPSRKTTCRAQVQEEENHSPPMPNFPPPAPPPELLDDSFSDIPEPTANVEAGTWRTVAMYDFEATHSDDLTLKAGDEVEVLSQVDENWLLGRVGDLIGHFPACFVQEQQWPSTN